MDNFKCMSKKVDITGQIKDKQGRADEIMKVLHGEHEDCDGCKEHEKCFKKKDEYKGDDDV